MSGGCRVVCAVKEVGGVFKLSRIRTRSRARGCREAYALNDIIRLSASKADDRSAITALLPNERPWRPEGPGMQAASGQGVYVQFPIRTSLGSGIWSFQRMRGTKKMTSGPDHVLHRTPSVWTSLSDRPSTILCSELLALAPSLHHPNSSTPPQHFICHRSSQLQRRRR